VVVHGVGVDYVATSVPTYSVSLSVQSVNDSVYAALPAPGAVQVSVTNPNGPGVVVSKGQVSVTVAMNATTSDSYTLVLVSNPLGTVVVKLLASSAAQFSVSPAALVFSAQNWSVPQAVTVTSVDDDLPRPVQHRRHSTLGVLGCGAVQQHASRKRDRVCDGY